MKSIRVWGVVFVATLLAPPGLAGQQPVPSTDGTEPAAVVRPAAEPIPQRLIKFSAVVKDALGQPRTGVVGVTFALYAEQEGGAPLWLETQNVELDELGRYTVLLGATRREGLPLKLFASDEARWLEIQVAGEPPQPRILLVSVPYALKAEEAERLAGRKADEFVLAEDLKTREGQEKLGLTGGGGVSATATTKATRFKATTATGPAFIWTGTSGPVLQTPTTALVANLNADLVDSLDSADLQRRVTGACPPGESIRVIGADGTVTCEFDNAGAGAGLGTPNIVYLAGCDSCTALTDDDDQHAFYVNVIGAMTIDSVTCISDVGTVDINLQRDDGTPAVVLSSSLSCSPSGAATSAFAGSENIVNLNDRLDFVVVSTGGVAKRVTVVIKISM